MTNRLSSAVSPYLLQHAHDPVDWEPWDELALARARDEDRPIFLSIGFATCHWCHVMARESFRDEHIAALLNRHFVPIKVDRDERPDLDEVYLQAVQELTGSAGWPLNVFLTPQLEPFFGGTYFAPRPGPGGPALPNVLEAVADAWSHKRDTLRSNARRVVDALNAASESPQAPTRPVDDIAEAAWQELRSLHDPVWGGFGEGAKFPRAPLLHFALAALGRDRPASAEVLHGTLGQMMRSSLYDLLRGGFHRYTTDREWSDPHFEKTLYDNALLARVYARASTATGVEAYERVGRETLDYIMSALRHEGGAFYAGEDSEAAGVEGAFSRWTFEEVREVVGDAAARHVAGPRRAPWEGAQALAAADDALWLDPEARRWRAALRDRQGQRPRPDKDAKIMAGWNGLAAIALAEAGQLFSDARYVSSAEESVRFVLRALRHGDGELARCWRQGQVSGHAYLEDYAALGLACLALHGCTGGPEWLTAALETADTVLTRFWDEDRQRLYLTPRGVDELPVHPTGDDEVALPSGSALAAELLECVGRIRGDDAYWRISSAVLERLAAQAPERVTGRGYALWLLERRAAPQTDVVVVGHPEQPGTQALLDTVVPAARDNATLAVVPPGDDRLTSMTSLARAQVDGQPTAYVCTGSTCLPPVTDPLALDEVLRR